MTAIAISRGTRVRAGGLAALMTLAIFVSVPAVEFLSPLHRRANRMLELRRVDALPPPPPPPPVERREPLRQEVPRPRLAEPRPRIPLQAVLSLDLNLGDIGGDFDVSFAVASPDLLGQVERYIFEISEIDAPPQPVARMRPQYPPMARMRSIEGTVDVEFVVGADGTVSAAAVTHSEPPGVFDDAALRAVKRWTFQPGTKDGVPVDVRVRQRLQFELEKGTP